MSYFTILEKTTCEFDEKKSIFITNIKRVNNEDEAKNFIDEIKGMHKEARHNVYAYILGENKGIQRYSDDGEPKGTGGIPILEVIKKNNITDAVVVVTRYFGGILLGTGGLTRAYSKGAAMGINAASIVEKVKGIPLNIIIDYDQLGKIQYYCLQNDWFIENIEYTDKVNIEIICESMKTDLLSKELIEVALGKIEIKKGQEEYYFKQNSRLIQLQS